MTTVNRLLAAKTITRLLVPLACLVMSACVTSPSEQPAAAAGAGLERGGWQDRYLTYNGTYDYFVGFDLQQLHADTNVDYEEKLDLLADYGINKVRIWLYPSFFGLPGDRNYPATGKILYPWRVDAATNKFDLDAWDPAFWARTRAFLAYARRRGIIVEVSLFAIQEPRNYFRNPEISYPYHHRDNLQEFGRPTDSDGRFMRGFFDLGYTDNGRSLADYHRAYIDKALDEFRSFDHIYYELINEAPGLPFWVNRDLPHTWMRYWISYIAARTPRIVTAHTSGFLNLRADDADGWDAEAFRRAGQRYWDMGGLDGFNVHLYSTDPNDISAALTGYQLQGKMRICNEGGSFYYIDKSDGYPRFRTRLDERALYGEIRHAWGMMTAGGYYSIYFGPVPQLGDRASVAGAKAMQALRHIVERTAFQTLRPVRADGTEYDDLVTGGPGEHWQVIADEGESYIVFFWGEVASEAVDIGLPAGRYRYDWMDTRARRAPLASGTVRSAADGRAAIAAPSPSLWHGEAGVVLVVRRQ
jgi:hypothetical protein